MRPELLEPLVRVFDWAMEHERSSGELICREHRVEHTGKTGNVAILAAELFAMTGEERFGQAAVRLGLRVAGRLEREGDSPCFTFRPGRHDPFNCSNSAIDGGAASDALALLWRRHAELGLSAEQRRALGLAALRHAQSYLQYAAVDKGIPAQRAWALTGLAASVELAEWNGGDLAREAFEEFEGSTPADQWPQTLRAACERALEVLASIQNADGSFPYHPLEWQPGHPGAGDASSFYQSRVTGFGAYALGLLGGDLAGPEHGELLKGGLDFLSGLYGSDGLKVGLVEAKPWYWGANYEVASHVFDCHALALGWRHFGREDLGRLALASFRSWAAHLDQAGQPQSHLPGAGRCPSYQCPMFWASHAAWAARAAGDLEGALDAGLGEGPLDLGPAHFESTSLVRLVSASGLLGFVRGGRPAGNVNHGSVQGAGLLRLVHGDQELIPRGRFGSSAFAEWTAKAGRLSWKRGWRAGRDELRFSLWTARVHLRAGRWLDAALDVPRSWRRAVLAFALPDVSSAFDREATLEVIDEGLVIVRGQLAWRDGSRVPGTSMERRFRMGERGLEVTESLEAGALVRGLEYGVPDGAELLDEAQTGTQRQLRWSLVPGELT